MEVWGRESDRAKKRTGEPTPTLLVLPQTNWRAFGVSRSGLILLPTRRPEFFRFILSPRQSDKG